MSHASAQITFEGLGTRWIVELLGDYSDFPAALEKLVRENVQLFDDTYSRFKADSLIGQLNHHGRLQYPPQELLDMFIFAHKMYDATDGAFDISVAPVLQNAGYGRLERPKTFAAGFWNEVKYNRDKIVIPGETAVDLGGFGKGWLIDRLAVLLEHAGYPYYVINGGGDLAVSAPEPIELGLEHPYEPEKIIGTTRLKKGGLAVSSVVKRRWVKDGETHHHIIDPATMKPSENGVVSTYVRGRSCLIADTLATIMLLRPELKEPLSKQFGVETIIITEDQLK